MGLIMGVGMPALYAWNRNKEMTIGGTIRLETYSKDLEDVKKEQKDGFTEIKDLIEAKDEQTHKWKNQILDKLSAMSLIEEKLGWRVGSVETELKDIREKKIAALEAELRDVHNHKSRIAAIEKELKDLNNRQRYGEKSSV